ncbi:hypothetical protein BBK82_34170 [Lentzea guizhouensis]|uniref:Integral membrane protein n=1 Tax=Lentzea guizhouensis TaxID=1586287 RepID=A0A1B2HRK4_9PSEU|nr:hypothetical protein [Lentzea guizhouensis]ANZ40328.1 hypothetical protein BBK82_34170 [Lentzea guizhouensis]
MFAGVTVPPAVAVGLALAAWAALLLRYALKLPRNKALVLVGTAALLPVGGFGGALAKGFPLTAAALMIGAAAVVPWLATNFRPELMVDAEFRGEDAATEEEVARTERYQWRAIAIIVVGVVAVFLL